MSNYYIDLQTLFLRKTDIHTYKHFVIHLRGCMKAMNPSMEPRKNLLRAEGRGPRINKELSYEKSGITREGFKCYAT